jgi:hypothetical protein
MLQCRLVTSVTLLGWLVFALMTFGGIAVVLIFLRR